jgi:hypothetical protein
VGGAVSWQDANRNNVDTAVEPIRNGGRNRTRELIQQGKAIRVEIVVGLQSEPRPIPLTPHILMPRPVGKLLCDVTRSYCSNLSGYAATSQNLFDTCESGECTPVMGDKSLP